MTSIKASRSIWHFTYHLTTKQVRAKTDSRGGRDSSTKKLTLKDIRKDHQFTEGHKEKAATEEVMEGWGHKQVLVFGTLKEEFGRVCPEGGRLRCDLSSLKHTPGGMTMTVDLFPSSWGWTARPAVTLSFPGKISRRRKMIRVLANACRVVPHPGVISPPGHRLRTKVRNAEKKRGS